MIGSFRKLDKYDDKEFRRVERARKRFEKRQDRKDKKELKRYEKALDRGLGLRGNWL